MTKKQLELRNSMNAKRPKFKHYCSHKYKRIDGTKWKKPKGMHNKMRLSRWGKPATVSEGYRGPKAARGLDKNGLIPVLVYNLSQLDTLDSKTQGVIVGKVGGRLKTNILTVCKEKNITLLNVKNIEESLKAIQDKLASKKEAKKESVKTKAEKEKAKIPKKEKKAEEEKDVKEEERKEMEKIITKRE